MNIDDKLTEIYYKFPDPTSISNIDVLYKEAKKNNLNVSRAKITDWLKKQEVYTLHKQRRVKFPRLKYNITNIDDLWQIDLMDMNNISRYNKNFRYILAVIDSFSKFGWCVPIKTKTSVNVIEAFNKIFKKTHRKPLNICSDQGREFVSNKFKKYLKERSINFYTINDPATKASICERFIRTIKSLMYKYFTHAHTKKYIDVIDVLVEIYNNRFHRTIRMKPNEVNESNILKVWKNMNETTSRVKSIFNEKVVKFPVGTFVRISNPKHIFEKGYEQLWSKEIFSVAKVILSHPHTYKLVDSDGEEITSLFYEDELQEVKK